MEIFIILAAFLYVYTHHIYCLVFLLFCVFIYRRLSYVLVFCLAFGYGLLHQYWSMPVLPVKSDVIRKASVQGVILSIAKQSSYRTQFYFDITDFNGRKVNKKVLLSWYRHYQKLKTGQIWRLQVKLKKPRNLANPGGFNYRQWLMSRHVDWTGYVKGRDQTLMGNKSESRFLLPFRQHLKQLLSDKMRDKNSIAVVHALTLGFTDSIGSSLWDLFRRTGVTHLMVISGAHIGLVAGLIFWLTRWLSARLGYFPLYCPAKKLASVFALAGAFCYALLAGFAIPAQRAFIACCFFSLHCLGNKKYSVWQTWRYALLLVLLMEPHAVLMPGLYLSFMAVATILLVNQQVRFQGLRKLLVIQAALLLGLIPLSLYWFAYASLSGFFANILAVPFVGFCIMPWSLLVLLLIKTPMAGWLIGPLESLITVFFHYLQWLDNISFINLSLPLTLTGSLFFLLILAMLVKWPIKFSLPSVIVALPVFLYFHSETVAYGDVVVRVLDVGQGLATVIQTHQHTLIYDTGDKFFSGNDMGQLVILPYLKTLGITAIDKVIISHPDKDHRGGLKSLQKALPVKEILVNDRRHYSQAKNCHHYPSWQWDGVTFRFFAIRKTFRRKNNRSCVLQIIHPKASMLLTGDIEKAAENYLANTYKETLQSKVLLVPHHGSKSSSSMPFLKMVSPTDAVVSLGFDNRYHFPHRQVIERYKAKHITFYSTKDCGMTSVSLSKSQPISCYKPT